MERHRRRKEHEATEPEERRVTVHAAISDDDNEPIRQSEDLEKEDLTEDEMREWERNLRNADGSRGARFSRHEIERAADDLGVKNTGYSLDDLWMAANMAYSDYCGALLEVCPANRSEETALYTKIGAAFLDDSDASVRGSEKLMLYYRCIVDE
nr:MAG TPA: hypothetical protein [Caudoviricetes sp.]